ncbi:unnamed protein product [Triticum turgidum subsp. durum]|uniref:Amino acid transporter transmembrane domain-containing protein n=1 Tax=Triticum turgidum subsp. durum TaxID=4567 RepID=A0A9R1S1I6_TRITD|nr:unnamed protein product [Triticum turgidum subsp. durum]
MLSVLCSYRQFHKLIVIMDKQIMYSSLAPDGPLKLYHFIIIVAVVLAFLSQLPSFHSLRHINLVSLLLSLGYTILVSAACIRAGLSKNAPAKDYSLSSSKSEQTFNAFLSISILASVFGNGILPFFFENLTKLYY